MKKSEIVSGQKAWLAWMVFIWEVFGIKLHLKTLLSPWHKDVITKKDRKYIFIERLVFNVITRTLGLTVRVLIILPGLVLLTLSIFLYPLFLILRIPVNLSSLKKHPVIGAGLAYGFTPFLKSHSRNLSDVSEVDLIGKEEALSHANRVLARKNQNNVLLVGDPGVGRTTLVEQLAKKIYWGDAPKGLRYRRVYEINFEGLGDEDISKILKEASNAGNIVVVIDNIHAYKTLPDILLPYLDVSGMQIIGVTDYNSFHSRLKKRTDLMRLFEKVELHEASKEETTSLLKDIAEENKIKVSDDVLSEIVRLTNQLIYHVPQPEKSIDILEELMVGRSKEIFMDDVHKILSEKTDVPVGDLSINERDKLLNLEELIKMYVVGQDRAVSAISEAIRRGRAGISGKDKPIGSFLFLGPTGVGKTYTAKTLASVYYGKAISTIRFDMSEYRELTSIEKFINRLIIAIEEDPFTLVLFDEIEKAHGDILNLLLQILDEARLTNHEGRSAYFNNAFIICTSNAGSRDLIKDLNMDKESLTNLLIERGDFRPEFLNRFDDIIIFSPLSMDHARTIAKKMLQSFAEYIKSTKKIKVLYEDGVIDALAKEGYDSRFGARAIRRELDDSVGNYVADKIIEENLKSDDTVSIPLSLFK